MINEKTINPELYDAISVKVFLRVTVNLKHSQMRMEFVCADVIEGASSGLSHIVFSLIGGLRISQNHAVFLSVPFAAKQGTTCKENFYFLINQLIK